MQGFLSRNVCLGRVGGIQVRVHLLFGLFLAVAARMQDRALDALISAAVGAGIGRKRRAALKALLDFPFWKSLVDAGVPGRDAPAIITDLALRVVERPGR